MTLSRRLGPLPTHLAVIALVLVWTIPTLATIVNSFRPPAVIQAKFPGEASSAPRSPFCSRRRRTRASLASTSSLRVMAFGRACLRAPPPTSGGRPDFAP